MIILNCLSSTITKLDLLTGAGKVMPRVITRLFARFNGFFYRILKTLPFRISQRELKISCTPILDSMLVDFFQIFKCE